MKGQNAAKEMISSEEKAARKETGFKMSDLPAGKVLEMLRSKIASEANQDKEQIEVVGGAGDNPEVLEVNKNAEQALDQNVEVVETGLSDILDKVAEPGLDREMKEIKDRLAQEAMMLVNDAEEILTQIKSLARMVEDAIATGGIVPKSLRKMVQSYEDGESLFGGLFETLKDKAAEIASAGITEEALKKQTEDLQDLSLQIKEMRESLYGELEGKLMALKNDAEKMAERGDFEFEGAVQRIEYLNEAFFESVDDLTRACGNVGKNDQPMKNVSAEKIVETKETITEMQPDTRSADSTVPDTDAGLTSEAVNTEEVDKGWNVEPAMRGTVPDILVERKTLRGGFQPMVIEGGKGKTEIAELGSTGTLIGDAEEMESESKSQITQDLLKDIPYPGAVDSKITIGEDYLSPEELEEFEGVQSESTVVGSATIPDEGLSLKEAVQEDAEEDERTKVLKNAEEPLSLRELMEMEEQEEQAVPAIVPEAGGGSLREMMDIENQKDEKERELMNLLKVLEGAGEISDEDRNKIVAEGERLLDVYTDEYGKEERQKLAEKWVDKFVELLDAAKAKSITPPVEAKSSRLVEGAMAVAGMAAAAKAAESGMETLREGNPYRGMGNDGESSEELVFTDGFMREHWNALTGDEQNELLDLQVSITEQEDKLAQLKDAKNAMERVFRAEYGDQFEVSARAQKTLREKANQMVKIETLIFRDKNAVERIKQVGKDRVFDKNKEARSAVGEYANARNKEKEWEQEEFPAKTSWWKEHPKLRTAAIGGGVVAGAGLFAGAWLASKLLKPLFHPFKTLEFLGNATEKFFGFLDRSIVKGDPIGAISDSVKSAEKFFGEKMRRSEEKLKSKGGKGVKYSTTE